jgi:hypothetical protein
MDKELSEWYRRPFMRGLSEKPSIYAHNACQGGKMNFLLFFGALCAVRTGAEAISKGRSGHGNGWFALGLLLNILALVLIAYLP